MRVHRNRITYTVEDDDGNEFATDIEPAEDSIISMQVGETMIFGFLVHDEHPENPFDAQDCLGKIYTCSHGDGTIPQYEESLQDPHHVMLSVYEHGMRAYSLLGDGIQCQWDTVNGGAVWVPDKYLAEELDKIESKKEYFKRKLEYAQNACDIANALEIGDVWGIVIQEGNDYDGKEATWDYIGGEYAKEELLAEMEAHKKWMMQQEQEK